MSGTDWNAVGTVRTARGEQRVTACWRDEAGGSFRYRYGLASTPGLVVASGHWAGPATIEAEGRLADFVSDPPTCSHTRVMAERCGERAVWHSALSHAWYCERHALPHHLRAGCAVAGCWSLAAWQESAGERRWLCWDHAPSWVVGPRQSTRIG
jgi:hypothetical protein